MKEILNLDTFWQITASSGLILSLLENVKIRIKTKLLRKQAWYFFTLILTFFFRNLGNNVHKTIKYINYFFTV